MDNMRCESGCDESMGFPARLRPAVRAALAALDAPEARTSPDGFLVSVDGEALRIPYRVYYRPELLRRRLDHAQGTEKLILACLGTRHHDGYLRQECLRVLLGGEASWLTPYMLQLAGEYVLEIVQDVADGIASRDPSALAAFARENPGYLATLARRITSYWSAYHRHLYPNRHAYPGARVLACLRQLLA
jgi:hypothetical protein